MENMMNVFADEYMLTYAALISSPVKVHARNGNVTHEICGHYVRCETSHGISVFSCDQHRVFPIKFALAELAWILSGRDDLESISSYCAAMAHFSDDNVTLPGAYGARLHDQWERVVNVLRGDISSRRAVLAIYDAHDLGRVTNDIPCNLSLQVLVRDDAVTLCANSRSSDFITGYPIDMFHWQALAHMFAHELDCASVRTVSYAIGSLHLYGVDSNVLEKWNVRPTSYKHVVSAGKSILTAVRDCRRHFSARLSIGDLCDVLGIADVDTCGMLHEMFRRRISRVTR